MPAPGRALLLALPGLALGAAGLLHPMHLTYATSRTWWVLHAVGLFVFPLVGVALIAVVRGRRDPVALLVVLAGFGYSCAYTALDVVNGIAAGYVTDRLGPGEARPVEVNYLFAIGRPLGEWGSWALLVAALVVVADAVLRWRLWAVPAVLMLPGAWLVHSHHIFAPLGATGMVLVGLSTGWLAYVDSVRTSITAARSIGP
jgi:hypothetical protein